MSLHISVIVPLYNKGPHIRDALDSILAQSVAAREVIVINDRSTDEGPAIAQSYEDVHSCVKVYHRDAPGPGGYAARNLGISLATSEWIAFLDADDVWKPRHLESMAEALKRVDPNVGCVFSGVEIVTATKRSKYRGSSDMLPVGKAFGLDTLLKVWLSTRRCPIWTGAVMFRRSLLEEAGLFPVGKGDRGGDKDMWLRAAASTQMVYTGETTSEFHQDTVNRVTKSTSHVSPPIIVPTARDLMARNKGLRASLLRDLLNQEIKLYARHALSERKALGREFLDSFQFDGRLRDIGEFLAYYCVGHVAARFG